MSETSLVIAGADDVEVKTTTELLEQRQEVLAIANQYGYTGSIAPDVLEENIRQSSQRIGMEMIAIGASLKMLKLQCGHGEFMTRVERAGFNKYSAFKMMTVAEKFSNVATSQLLENMGRSQITELALGMDKEEVEQLMSGEEVRGITADDVRLMTVRELREALQAKDKEIAEAKANYEARGKVLENKQKQIDDMAEKLAKKEQADLAKPEDAREKLLRAELTSKSMDVQSLIMVTMKDGIEQLLIEGEKTNTDHRPFLSALMSELLSKITHVQEAFVLYDSFEQEPWMIEDIDQAREAVEASVDAAMTRETGV